MIITMTFGPEIVMLGLFTGFLVGLTGVGGAALLTPVMILFGMNPSIAVGTDLFYNSITKFLGAIQHVRQKTVNFKLVRQFACGSIPGAIAAAVLLKLHGSFSAGQETWMKLILAVMLIIVACLILFRQWLEPYLKENRWQAKAMHEKRNVMIAVGFVLGVAVGMTSIGSGSLFALALLYFFRMKGSEIVGTDIAHAFLLVTAAGLMHAGMGHVNYALAFQLLAGSVPGVMIGSTLSAKVPTKPLRAVMAMLILISGVMMI